ncbi:lanthionine synthetase LanC family protein [Actinoplanes sp. NPDC051470]|uniref:lanthionine synthetase LanC family protein n=1 Tax=Actinoplanes sp. NPDC051470 TaxID=3157224 RepID=UPI003440F288
MTPLHRSATIEPDAVRLDALRPDADGIDDLAARVRIHPDTGISWFGETAVPPLQVADELVPDALRSHLADIIYSAHYVFGAPRPISAVENLSPALSSNAGMVRELLSAYRGGRSWQPTFEQETETDITLWGVRFLRPELTSDDHSRRLPTALPMRSPGFVYFVGDQGPHDIASTGECTTRLYWNVSRRGAPELVAGLSAALNDRSEPFQFKIAHSGPTWPERADVAVLYLPASRLVARWKTILAVYDEVRADLRPWTPAYTRTIAPGLALADDPAGGLSFGQTISRILAAGIVDDHIRHGSRSTPATRAVSIRLALAGSGRPAGSTHLNPGNRELDLQLPAEPGPLAARPSRPATLAARRSTLAAAHQAEQLADLVAGLAVTAGHGCTWFTRGADPDDATDLRTVEAELYDGLSGIAMFLAHAHAVLGKPRYAELAEMAAASALDRLHAVQHHHGLYGGRVGAAATVAEVGRTLTHRGLRDDAIAYLLAADAVDDPDAAEPAEDVRHHDLIYGISGTVLAYCWAAQSAGPGRARQQLLDRASAFGQQLAAHTHAELGAAPDAGPVPGLAHGPSSTVLALTELSRLAGGVADLDRAAALAVEHERRHFDHTTQNWPGGPSGAEESRFNWCYGAPGIALARLVLAEGAVATEDLTLAARAVDAAGARFLGRSADSCACHGKLAVAGAAELITHLTDLPMNAGRQAQLLTEAFEHYHTGSVTRTAPGLMTGAAGAGLTALRACAPRDVPSPLYPLLPRRREDKS